MAKIIHKTHLTKLDLLTIIGLLPRDTPPLAAKDKKYPASRRYTRWLINICLLVSLIGLAMGLVVLLR